MKLDRNLPGLGGRRYEFCKYGLIRNRRILDLEAATKGCPEAQALLKKVDAALWLLEGAGIIDWGDDRENEFFVLRLRDTFAAPALAAYADAARDVDPEYSFEVAELAGYAGDHPNRKIPD